LERQSKEKKPKIAQLLVQTSYYNKDILAIKLEVEKLSRKIAYQKRKVKDGRDKD